MKNTEQILITGGAGFIGSHLSEFLLKSGFRVTCVDNFNDFYNPEIKEHNILKILNEPYYSLYRTDIRKRDGLELIFEKSKPDLVIHLAAMPGVGPSIKNPLLYYDVNVTGTVSLLETMRKTRVHNLIFASSSSVYGNNLKVPFSESDCTDKQISPYAASKKAGEVLCHSYHNLFDFNITCLRFFTVYGPRQRPDLAIHKFTNRILENKPLNIYGDGNSSRDYTYVTDVIEGIGNAIANLNGYNIYNIGESRTITLTNLIYTLENALGLKAKKNYLPSRPGDVEITFADINKARKGLGYKAGDKCTEGIEQFIKWKREVTYSKISD
jgi:UDP-glucuronate 4-epimerase